MKPAAAVFLLSLAAASLFASDAAPANAEPKTAAKTVKAGFDGSFLPEVLLKYDGKPLTREQGLQILERSGFAPAPDASKAEICDKLRRAIDEELCRTIIRAKLAKHGIVPSRDMAMRYLKDSAKAIPEDLSRLAAPPDQYGEIAADRDYQLTVALMRYFDTVEPGKLKPDDSLVENFYRANQITFMTNGKLDIAFIGVAGSDGKAHARIETAAARLRQGESFDRIAEEYNAALPDDFYDAGRMPAALIRAGAELKIGEPGGITELPHGLAIVMLRGRGEPRYISLADAAYFIRMTMRSRMAAAELSRMIRETLSERKIEYFF